MDQIPPRLPRIVTLPSRTQHCIVKVLFKTDFHYTLILTVITTELQLTTLGHCVGTLQQYLCE
jgi:hypothetical protein